jgi:hypothetical protein
MNHPRDSGVLLAARRRPGAVHRRRDVEGIAVNQRKAVLPNDQGSPEAMWERLGQLSDGLPVK